MRATAYVLDPSENRSLPEIAAANDGVIPVIELQGVPATAEHILSTFKRFKIVALPSHVLEPGQRFRIDRT
jgi:hypothetical protein